MKKQILHIAAALSLFLMLGASAAAQTSREMSVNIPFDFYVGKTELPAGAYTIYRTSATSGYGFILRSEDLKTAVMFNARVIRTSEAGSGSRIEFRRHNDRYFLSRILPAGSRNGHQLETARIDGASSGDIAHRSTKQTGKSDTVTVSAR
ncbi:MAG: hypothetical protein IPM66_05105 [Acidobacteriota bacterium]|nr:MAG: hypothetical protein IPM66_05105 [Acidobacteriota bacterium]